MDGLTAFVLISAIAIIVPEYLRAGAADVYPMLPYGWKNDELNRKTSYLYIIRYLGIVVFWAAMSYRFVVNPEDEPALRIAISIILAGGIMFIFAHIRLVMFGVSRKS